MDISRGLSVLAPYALAAAGTLALCAVLATLFRRRIGTWFSDVSAEQNPWDGASRAGLLLALTLVWWLGSIELIASVGLVVGVSVGAWCVAIASVLAVVFHWFAVRSFVSSRHVLTFGLLTGCVAGIVVSALLLSGAFFDVSWDGNTAHQVAVAELESGWNPIYQPVVERARIDQWLATESFPKGTWIRGAVIFRLAGVMEQAKASGLVLAATVWFAWVALLLAIAGQRHRSALVLAIVMAVNPVVLAQAFTFMVDGQVASLFALSLALSGLLFTRLARWPVAAALGITLMMLATAKFTGLVYAVALALGIAVAVMMVKPCMQRRIVAVWVCGGLIAAVGLVGFNPYAQNMLQGRSIFYPLVGSGTVDIMTNNSPGDFVGTNRFERLFRSLFSRADHQRGSSPQAVVTQLKIPFTVHQSEIRPYLAPETRIAGFGPLFGGILVLSLVGVVLLLTSERSRRDRVVLGMLYAQVVIVSTVLVNPEGWWARYAPQLWLVPVLTVAALLLRGVGRRSQFLGWTMCGLLLVNAVFVGTIGFANTVNARMEIGAVLDRVAASPGVALLQQQQFETTWAKLEARGITYRIVSDETTLVGGVVIPYTTGIVSTPR